ncbi:MAG TPA: ATP-binding protein, partial [Candidatus Kapabacteria bacterium]|nr:ATP-binding protein [Candidatus Kapabacteria bacterium]
PKAMLITCIRCNGKYEAYFIFDNMHDENAFDDEDILLLKNLKEHFVTAFQKARLISQLKNAQVQLIQSEKMRALGDMVANIAHEINNPASFIHTTSYNLRRDMDKFKAFVWGLSGEDVEKEIEDAFEEKFDMLFKHLNTLDEGTNRIKETVNALRVFSRMEKSEVNSVNLHEGLQATLNLVKSKYKEEIDFITDFQPLLEIQGNLAEMNQVFMNIIKNACQSIIEKQKKINDNKKGTVTIKTFTQNDEIMIIFQDTGTGIPQKIREKMFEPFFTTRATGEGTGLGLSVSFGIIKKHQGRIDVESEEGKGTTITLHLPIYQTHQNS